MTTPAYANPISLGDINNEFGTANFGSAFAGAGYVPNGTIGYPYGNPTPIPSSGSLSMANFWGATKIVQATLTGVETPSGTYQAQTGFSVDRWDDNGLRLTIGLWTHDPPHSQHADWHWLQYGGVENANRRNTGATNFWETVDVVNIDNIAVGQTITYLSSNAVYRFVPGTFYITRTAVNQLKFVLYPDSRWNTGDTGTTISIDNWYNIMLTFGGATYQTVQTGTDENGSPQYETTVTNKGQWYLTW